jgi:hypothetical protein
MPTKFGRRQHERNPVPTGTLNNRAGDVSYQVSRFAVSEAIPMVKKRVKAILHANPRPVSYYQKLPVGQRCSCWGLGDTPQAFCVSCFAPGTLVRTAQGFRPIEQVAAGDEVLAADGRYHRVQRRFKLRHDGSVYRLRTSTMTSAVLVTPEHPFLVLRGRHQSQIQRPCGPKCDGYIHSGDGLIDWFDVRQLPSGNWHTRLRVEQADATTRITLGTFATRREGLQAVQQYRSEHPVRAGHQLEWHTTDCLTTQDWLVPLYPRTTQDVVMVKAPYQDRARGPVCRGPREFAVDDELLWVVGLYLAEGSSGTRKIQFSLHRKEISFQQRLVAYFTRLGYEVAVRPTGDNSVNVVVNSAVLAKWWPSWLGRGCQHKRIPEEFMRLPNHKLRQLLQGVYDGDGSKRDREITQTSEVLALQLVEILHRLGEQPLVRQQVTPQLTPGGNQRKTAFCVNWAEAGLTHDNRKGRWQFGTNLLTQVRELTKENYHGWVYNLEVESDPTYSVQGVLTHNCFGTGFVIGYEKRGCVTHMLDATSELSLVNVVPNRKLAMAPIPLALIDKALRGSVEMAVRLQANAGILDCWRVYQSTPPGTAITLLVRTPTETAWTPATEAAVQARLQGGVLLIRAELTRQSLTTDKPYLRAIRLRYQLQPGDTRVLTNTPIGEDMLSVQEFGIVETFTALSFIFDDTLKLISPLDFMYDARTDRRWIVQSARNQNPYGYTLFWHVQARLAQPFDTVAEFPL